MMSAESSEPTKKRPCPDPLPSPSLETTLSDNQPAVPGHENTSRPSGQPAVHVNPQHSKSGDMTSIREEVKEARHRDSICVLCSGRKEVYHPHHSTQQLREFAQKYRTTGSYSCIICKKEEQIELPSNVTRRVVLSDSTLYNIWDITDLKVNAHFEMEAIVGGRVQDLTRALDKMYLDKPNRLEIIVVCGINNISDGQSPEDIMADFADMKQIVAEHSVQYGHSPPSYVSISTCILPPKYTSFHVPQNVPSLAIWRPIPSFCNYATSIERLNTDIMRENNSENVSFVGLHLLGMKYFKSGTKQHKFDTKPDTDRIWRENLVFRKLHFTQKIKTKIVEYILLRFEDNEKRVTTD